MYYEGVAATDASQVCRCAVSIAPYTSWATDGYVPYDKATLPEMSRSDTGYAPCSLCPDNSAPYIWEIVASSTLVIYHQTDPCYCNPGFKSIDGLSPCTPCSSGSDTLSAQDANYEGIYRYVYATGATSCQCIQGYFSIDGTDSKGACTKCPLGTTTPSIPSETNRYAISGSTSCDYCSTGWYSTDGKSSSGCILCPEGTTTTDVGTAGKCNLCDVDYFSPSGAGPCSKCSDGYGTNGLKGQTHCSQFLTTTPTMSPPTPGPSDPTIVPTRKPVVTRRPSPSPTSKPTVPGECEIGFFSATGLEPCTPCPEHSSNAVTGMKTCYCSAGFYGEAGIYPCFQCMDGYISTTRESFCTPCIGFAPCTKNYPQATPAVTSSPSLQRTSKPTKPKKSKKKYFYQTHSPSRQPTKGQGY